MAKSKALKPFSEAMRCYVSRLNDFWDKETSEMNKALRYYELQAKLVLISAGYMTEQGTWIKGYDADALSLSDLHQGFGLSFPDRAYYTEFDKMKPIVQKAVMALKHIKECRQNVRDGEIEEAVLEMEKIVHYTHKVRLKRLQARGGKQPKSWQGIMEAITELHEKGYKTARQMWDHLRVLSTRKKVPEPYMTVSGIIILFVPDAVRSGYLCEDGDPPYITFRTFQSYLTEVKKSLSK
jgi:hypothetical protein